MWYIHDNVCIFNVTEISLEIINGQGTCGNNMIPRKGKGKVHACSLDGQQLCY